MSSPTCYVMSNGTIFADSGRIPCGPPSSTGFVQCCGSLDHICGADGFCHTIHELSGGSGYYLGGCTDATFKDPSCGKECSKQGTADVVFNNSNGLWSCCFDNVKGLDCSSPTEITFEDPGPDVLFSASFSILTASSQSSTSTQSIAASTTSSRPSTTVQTAGFSQTVRATATATSTNSADLSSGLNTGAKAGIGVSVALVVMIGLGILLVLRWRRRHRQQFLVQDNSMSTSVHEKEAQRLYESGPSERKAEMSGDLRSPVELPHNGAVQHEHTFTELA